MLTGWHMKIATPFYVGCDIIMIVKSKTKGAIIEMLQAYQGYIQVDGRFVADNPSVKLPTQRKVIITILEDEYARPANTDRQHKVSWFRKIMQEASAAENELTDADWDELENIRKDTNAGMSRTVDL